MTNVPPLIKSLNIFEELHFFPNGQSAYISHFYSAWALVEIKRFHINAAIGDFSISSLQLASEIHMASVVTERSSLSALSLTSTFMYILCRKQ